MLSNKFENIRPTGDTLQGILPAAALPVGTALVVTSVDADTGERTFAVANLKADGFLVRESVVPADGTNGNPRTDTQILYNQGLEVPFTAGRHGTIEWGCEIEAEGTDLLLTSGTGALASNTAEGTVCSFKGGKFYEAQTGDLGQFRVVAQMTPITAGQVRIKFAEIEGYTV
jgi:hypothetical protein